MSDLDQESLIEALEDFENIFSDFIFDTSYQHNSSFGQSTREGKEGWQDGKKFVEDLIPPAFQYSSSLTSMSRAYSFSPTSIASFDSEKAHGSQGTTLPDSFESTALEFFTNEASDNSPSELSFQVSPGSNPSPISIGSNPSPMSLDAMRPLDSNCRQMEVFFQTEFSGKEKELYSQPSPDVHANETNILDLKQHPKYRTAPTSQDPKLNGKAESSVRTIQEHASSLNGDVEDKVPIKYQVAPKIPLFKLEGSCHVCGEVAGKHTAYGGKVCPSCRAFFRRSVQTRYYEIFSCEKDDKCLIDSKTRKSCKFCRFTKCLQARMQISWVLSEKERDRRYNKLKKAAFRNDLQRNGSSESPARRINDATLTLAQTPEIHFTIEEQLHLEQLRSYMINVTNARYETFFTYERSCLNHLAQVSYFGGIMDYTHWKRFIDASDYFAQEMFLHLDIMKELTPNDQIALIRANGLPSYCYMESIYTDEEDPSLCICLDILQRQQLTHAKPVIRYNSIYKSPWAATLQDEERHKVLLQRMKCWALPSRGNDDGENGFDPLLTSLMRIQIGFSPLSVPLEHPEVCHGILQRYQVLMYRYIKNKYGIYAEQRFTQAMDICVTARQAAEIVRRRLPI